MTKQAINRIFYGWLLIMTIVALIGKVSVAAPNAGRTAADFLQVGIGARAAGLGGAYTALSEGPEASWWNPAGLASFDHKEFTVGHFMWYQDITLEHGAFAFPVSQNLSMAASMVFVNYGKIAGYDQYGSETGNLSAHDWAGGLSLGMTFTDQISGGVTARVISQKLAEVSAMGFAADFGVTVHLNKFVVAASATNFGTNMKFESEAEKLPSAVKVGVAYAPSNSAIVGAFEIEKKLYGDLVTRQGIELRFANQYFLRSGLNFYPGQRDYRTLQAGYSVGAGVHVKNLMVDYAFSPANGPVSDDLHRFSIGFQF